MRILPAIDIWQGNVVRLSEGKFSTATVYGDDPPAMARRWQSEGADLIHVVDLEGALHGSFNQGLWDSMATANVPFQAGGGLRSAEIAIRVIEAGASRAVLGSLAVWRPEELAELVATVGEDQVVAAVDVLDERAMGSGWKDDGRPLLQVLPGLMKAGIRRVLLTAIARDGMLAGPDLDLLARVRTLFPGLRLIASGGISGPSDLADLAALEIEEVVVGKALYERRIVLPKVG